jgi:hypothetical protein
MSDEPISSGSGTADDPWRLETLPLTSEYTLHRDADGTEVLVCTVGKSVLMYDARCIDIPPLLEHLGLVELEHDPRNNRMRAR